MDPLINLNPLQPLAPLGDGSRPQGQTPGQPSFSEVLQQALRDVDEAQAQAEVEARKLMTGEGADMHSAILAVQKADVSFQMMMAVRSKLIDAYREVMRMQM
ncbi:MAG: flagellar hook-basal body complex protein FliE [Acidobacteria bacterium]|nr:flagellar hook-basal body complex protein FliE [Acidobacteriota bacterium]